MVELNSTTENRWKELAPAEGDARHAIFYLGMNDHFEEWYVEYCERRVRIIEAERDKKKAQEGEEGDEENAEDAAPVLVEEEPDKEQVFLGQFPNLSVFYKQNTAMFYKYRKKRDFDIAFGGWIPPTCCSLLINFIQWYLTFSSVLYNKGDGGAFWLPELIRSDLDGPFKQIQDVSTFWKFIENDLADYAFTDVKLLDENGDVDRAKLNEFNTTTLAQNAKGRLYIGPIRFMQKRIKAEPCKRSSNIGRYKK